jgi:phenylpropionate dioxygenase-like ring-hydroxylating dioxygenase large terminal subunit
MSPEWRFLPPKAEETARREPDWKQARPESIAHSLDRALARPSGGWYVLDASRRIGARPRAFEVEGEHLVAWRHDGALLVAPESCPHLGASLVDAKNCDGALVCPWHGLALGRRGHGDWKPLTIHEDGVLSWVRLDRDGEEGTPEPILAPRPTTYMDGVIFVTAKCRAADVIANRLDPWHGAYFHPYAFGTLEVLDENEDLLTVRVEKRIAGPVRVEVDATFHSPEPRTIVMTIVAGEGAGSVVETHATPMGGGRTAIVEATLATSDRKGFRHAQKLTPLIRPFIERSARRLWVDDAAYAERLQVLRDRS